jgi:hypothetical protein
VRFLKSWLTDPCSKSIKTHQKLGQQTNVYKGMALLKQHAIHPCAHLPLFIRMHSCVSSCCHLTSTDAEAVPVRQIDNSAVLAAQLARLAKVKASRDDATVAAALQAIEAAARSNERQSNLLELAVQVGAQFCSMSCDSSQLRLCNVSSQKGLCMGVGQYMQDLTQVLQGVQHGDELLPVTT